MNAAGNRSVRRGRGYNRRAQVTCSESALASPLRTSRAWWAPMTHRTASGTGHGGTADLTVAIDAPSVWASARWSTTGGARRVASESRGSSACSLRAVFLWADTYEVEQGREEVTWRHRFSSSSKSRCVRSEPPGYARPSRSSVREASPVDASAGLSACPRDLRHARRMSVQRQSAVTGKRSSRGRRRTRA